jgi:hypothetical protein
MRRRMNQYEHGGVIPGVGAGEWTAITASGRGSACSSQQRIAGPGRMEAFLVGLSKTPDSTDQAQQSVTR